MNALLDPRTAERLAQLLGMLGSDHDGEIANAGRMADRLLRSRGLTWPDIIRPYTDNLHKDDPPIWREPRTWREAVGLALGFEEMLTPWESKFLRSLRDQHGLSAKQHSILCDIVDKLRDLAGEREAA
jgi:hypothetical protein